MSFSVIVRTTGPAANVTLFGVCAFTAQSASGSSPGTPESASAGAAEKSSLSAGLSAPCAPGFSEKSNSVADFSVAPRVENTNSACAPSCPFVSVTNASGARGFGGSAGFAAAGCAAAGAAAAGCAADFSRAASSGCAASQAASSCWYFACASASFFDWLKECHT